MKIYPGKFKAYFPALLVLSALMILNLIIVNLPLSNTLGYEFAAVNGIILFLTGGLLTISSVKRTGFLPYIFLFRSNIWFSTLIVIIPLIIGSIATIFFSRCPITDGILFYLVITVPSFIFGSITGYFSSALSIKWSVIIYLLFFLLLCFIPIA
ncbi:MAG: hypothetical protein WC061_04830, partial [Melioribacteraceae bacterium]